MSEQEVPEVKSLAETPKDFNWYQIDTGETATMIRWDSKIDKWQYMVFADFNPENPVPVDIGHYEEGTEILAGEKI